MYFRKQQHSSLAAYLGQLLRDKDEQNLTAHGQGGLLVQVLVFCLSYKGYFVVKYHN